MLRIVIENQAQTAAMFNRLSRGQWLRVLFLTALDETERYINVYAPELQGSDYRRRGAAGGLASRWGRTFKFSPRSTLVEVYNTMPGAEYVLSKDMQARIHRERWRTDAEALDVAKAVIEKDVSKVLFRSARG